MTQPAPEASQAPSPGQPGAEGQPTEAQQNQAEQAGNVNPADGTPVVSEEQQKQYEEDQRQALANGGVPVGRDANPEFGGEGFGYGQRPTQ